MENQRVNDIFGDRCPECSGRAAHWRERPQYGSRELFWMGCKDDGILVGANSMNAALQSWQRKVAQIKFMKAGKP